MSDLVVMEERLRRLWTHLLLFKILSLFWVQDWKTRKQDEDNNFKYTLHFYEKLVYSFSNFYK